MNLRQVQDGTVFSSSNLIKQAEESLIQKKSFDSGKSSGFHLADFHDVVWFSCYVMEVFDQGNMCFSLSQAYKEAHTLCHRVAAPMVHPLETNTFH